MREIKIDSYNYMLYIIGYMSNTLFFKDIISSFTLKVYYLMRHNKNNI